MFRTCGECLQKVDKAILKFGWRPDYSRAYIRDGVKYIPGREVARPKRFLLEARKVELNALREWMFEHPEEWASSPERVSALQWTTKKHEEEIRTLETQSPAGRERLGGFSRPRILPDSD